MLFLRSLIFNIFFFGWALLSAVLFMPFFIISMKAAQNIGRPWAQVSLFLARVICGITYEIRGSQYIAKDPVIYASKHQSAWDTIIFHITSRCPAYVLKRELLFLPLWGWYLWRMKMIAIDRAAKASSMKHMLKQAKEIIQEPRSIVIFPEGTRTAVGAPSQYHPGIIALYSQLKIPVVPVALNSGVYWKKDAFIKRPGKIIIEFLPPIPPGLPKEEFIKKLQETVESASQRLVDEAKSGNLNE